MGLHGILQRWLYLFILRFPLPILIPPMLLVHLLSGAGTPGPQVIGVPSALSLTVP
jgi:hypothetical protein